MLNQPLMNMSAQGVGRNASILLLGLLLGPSAMADFRCGRHLVDIGQRYFEVEERCGKADYRMSFPVRGIGGQVLADHVQHWYYNPGPQGFIHKLTFQNAELIKDDTLGRGFYETDTPSCRSSEINLGMSEYALYTKCGQPISKRILWRGFPVDDGEYIGVGGYYLPVQEWVYGFGRSQFRRAVIVENGQVSEIELLSKPR